MYTRATIVLSVSDIHRKMCWSLLNLEKNKANKHVLASNFHFYNHSFILSNCLPKTFTTEIRYQIHLFHKFCWNICHCSSAAPNNNTSTEVYKQPASFPNHIHPLLPVSQSQLHKNNVIQSTKSTNQNFQFKHYLLKINQSLVIDFWI